MTVVVLVLGAAILLTLMLVGSYSGRDGRPVRRTRPAQDSHGGDGWMFMSSGSDGGSSDCGASDGGGCGGDGGGGGGGD